MAQVRILVRGDSAFSNDELMVWCEKERDRLRPGVGAERSAEAEDRDPDGDRPEVAAGDGQGREAVPGTALSDAQSWSCERRVVAKVEHLPRGKNPRFIVTSVPVQECDGRRLYEESTARGETWRIG